MEGKPEKISTYETEKLLSDLQTVGLTEFFEKIKETKYFYKLFTLKNSPSFIKILEKRPVVKYLYERAVFERAIIKLNPCSHWQQS